jgi:hypothetical protein
VTSWLREHSGTIAVEVLSADEVEAWMGAPPGPLYGEHGFFVRVTLENPDSGLVLEAADLSGSLRDLDLRSDLIERESVARSAIASFVPSYDSSEWREPTAARSSSSGDNVLYMLTFGWIVSIMTMGGAPPDALAWEDSMFASEAQRAAKRQRQASESAGTPEAQPRTHEAARPESETAPATPQPESEKAHATPRVSPESARMVRFAAAFRRMALERERCQPHPGTTCVDIFWVYRDPDLRGHVGDNLYVTFFIREPSSCQIQFTRELATASPGASEERWIEAPFRDGPRPIRELSEHDWSRPLVSAEWEW